MACTLNFHIRAIQIEAFRSARGGHRGQVINLGPRMDHAGGPQCCSSGFGVHPFTRREARKRALLARAVFHLKYLKCVVHWGLKTQNSRKPAHHCIHQLGSLTWQRTCHSTGPSQQLLLLHAGVCGKPQQDAAHRQHPGREQR